MVTVSRRHNMPQFIDRALEAGMANGCMYLKSTLPGMHSLCQSSVVNYAS